MKDEIDSGEYAPSTLYSHVIVSGKGMHLIPNCETHPIMVLTDEEYALYRSLRSMGVTMGEAIDVVLEQHE